MRLLASAREGTLALVDLVLPGGCAGCAATGTSWCRRCSGLLAAPTRVHPPSCPPTLPVYALGGYNGRLRTALLAYKERGRRELAAPLGAALATALRTLVDRDVLTDQDGGSAGMAPGYLYLVPVPSRWSAATRRGGQHVAALAEHAAAALAGTGVPAAVAPALRMAPGVRDSVGLDRSARRHNLAGRIRARPAGLPPVGTPVVLVDDVVTTGATTAACVTTLLQAGVEVSAMVVLAAAERHSQS